MSVSFVRQLGAESGIQLNPLQDRSEIPSVDNWDQNFAIACRLTRGRIDKPFPVNKSNYLNKLGPGESMRASALNEAYVHIVEAVNKGAYEAIVQRLVTENAIISYAVATIVDDDVSWAVGAAIPSTPYLLAIKHLECFNDGIQCEIHADIKRDSGSNVANDVIRLVIKDKKNNPLFDFTGSLDPDAIDDYQNSIYLPDVVSRQTDAVEVTVGASITSIGVVSNAYGYSVSGLANWAKSGVLICFDEGGTGYSTADYSRARTLLQNTNYNYGYISSGGSQATALIAQLIQLAYDTNRILAMDIYGGLTKDAAITFYEQLNVGGNYESSDLVQSYWSPLKLTDPTGINGKTIIGRATLLIAYACRRNAVKNSRLYCEEKKNPIAGRDYPLYNQGITQLVQVSQFDKNDLARAHINPVIGGTYTGGFRYVFFDSLTGAAVTNSKRKNFAVIDMSVDVAERITRYGNDILQKDRKNVVRKLTEFLHQMRADLYAAEWVVDPEETNPAFATDYFSYEVMPHPTLIDAVIVNWYPCYNSTTRQIYCTQTLT